MSIEIQMRRIFMGKVQGKNEPDAMYQEKKDAQMIREDHNAMANLPPKGGQFHWNASQCMQSLGTDRGVFSPGVMEDGE